MEFQEPSEPSPELSGANPPPDFNAKLKEAQANGDYDFVMNTAKQSHRMLVDFQDVIAKAQFQGRDAQIVAMGLNFIINMIGQSAGQLQALKRAEKESKEAVKSALQSKSNGTGPEEPVAPTPEAPSA